MNALRCLRAAALPTLKPSLAQPARTISLLSVRRPLLPPSSSLLAAPGTPPSATATLDILPKISASPALAGTQIRCGPRDTYNPSHIVRKRRHGFLSRLRTKKGRKLLMRRLVKGRSNLSH